MAQANAGGESRAGRFALRTVALIIGLVGAALALVIVLLYTIFGVLGKVAGVSSDTIHFFWGLFVILMAVTGSLLAPVLPIVAAVLLVVAGIALFFIVGWWALIASPCLFVAAALTFSNRRVDIPGAA
jgi:hypothetical protein